MAANNQSTQNDVVLTDPPLDRFQVQEAIGCRATTFWKLIGEGEFPNAFKVRGSIRVPLSDVEAYIERQQSEYRQTLEERQARDKSRQERIQDREELIGGVAR